MGQYYKVVLTKNSNWYDAKYASDILDKERGVVKTLTSNSYWKRWEWDMVDHEHFFVLEKMLKNDRGIVSICGDYSRWSSHFWYGDYEEKDFYELADKLKREEHTREDRQRYIVNYTYKLYVDMDEIHDLYKKYYWDSKYFGYTLYHPLALLCNMWDAYNVDEYYRGLNKDSAGCWCDTVVWMSDTIPEWFENFTKVSLFVQDNQIDYRILRTYEWWYISIKRDWSVDTVFDNYDEIAQYEYNKLELRKKWETLKKEYSK